MQPDAAGTSEKHPAGKSVANNVSANSKSAPTHAKPENEVFVRGKALLRRFASGNPIEVETSSVDAHFAATLSAALRGCGAGTSLDFTLEASPPARCAWPTVAFDMSESFGNGASMRPRLQRLSLVDQLDVALREGLARGDWPDWLPSERQLCADLQVGRNSLRAALQRLADEGMVEIVPGQGTRNSGRISDPPTPEPNVFGLLSPISLEQLRPRQALWIDELRRVLSEAGGGLRFVHGPQFFRANPAPTLQRLVSHERCGGWILVRSTKVIQLWFARHGVPCVIAGSCHQGVDLPFVDLDYQAMCRHAATTLLQLGHRRIAFLTQVADAAGDLRSELGFVEGVEKFPAVGIEGKVVHHDSETRSVAQCVRRLMQGPRAPTALVVNQSYHYLTVFSVLVQLGRRIPQDVSLICRDDDRFLAFLEPEPARYVENPHLFARKLARIAMATFRERPAQPMRLQIMPRLMRGASISRCAAPEGNEAKA